MVVITAMGQRLNLPVGFSRNVLEVLYAVTPDLWGNIRPGLIENCKVRLQDQAYILLANMQLPDGVSVKEVEFMGFDVSQDYMGLVTIRLKIRLGFHVKVAFQAEQEDAVLW